MKDQISRRTFLRAALGSAAAPAILKLSGCQEPDHFWDNADLLQSAQFPGGVVSGSPTSHGITLLAEVAERSGSPRLGLEVAEDSELARIVYRGIVELPFDAAVPVRVTIDDPALQPGGTYYYRFVLRNERSPVRRFTTLCQPDDSRPARMAFFSCQGWQAGYYTAHVGLAAEPNLNLVLCLGDYIYEWTDGTGPADRVDLIGDGQAGFAQTAEEYRAKYRLYRSDLDLQAMHKAQSMVAVWDNHDLGDPLDWRMPPPRLSWEERKANGRAVFWEQMPMAPGPSDQALYRSIRIGAHLELFLLDLHSYAALPGSDGPYAGEAQFNWLISGMRRSTATWKVVASSTVMMGLELAPGTLLNLDQWDGYPTERRRLIEEILKNEIKDVVVVSGDLHTFLVAPVTATGRAGGGDAGLVEFCGGAISSQGLLKLTPDDAEFARALEQEAQERNPHLSYIEVLARGYGVLEARPDELLVTFRSPKTVLEKKSPMRDLARFRVRRGIAAAERLDNSQP